ncbi:head GIN domain-containing protein [Arenibacter sp. ARW7G5Y1]|uniref:head GIN domain-containing protein n=1 Tax=Arenibacter sp. ARW7G5Y1 TaxID=2135619 RepID=UPI000D765608|nr:head GIN domain-containing protein [Arenibacter sp. ARW7G5Y1]PXX28433.1 putative autotransporter adhesin-like protein [Arenibacter sp. ARW7G5Y1]|tara:strand:- start:3874 stop:4599 length:726 start_codon:yes stop_codon:yes gene_type:complete
MATSFKINFLIAFTILSISCEKDTITVSEDVTSKDHEFSGYTSLEVNDNFNIYISFSDTEEKLRVEANDNLHEYILLNKESNKLTVKLDKVRRIKGKETLNVFITTKSINNFTIKGNTTLELEEPLETDNIKMYLSGNSFFSGTLTAEKLDLVSKGNCMIELLGSVKNMDMDLGGNCELSDYDLSVDSLKINLSGNSNAYLTANNSIWIDASGNSVLSYKGNATIAHKKLSSDSKIVKMDN